jgi:syntaxin-binding protein 5
MTLDGDSYSSILLHVGTSGGVVATLKILPGNGGRYSAQLAGVTSVDDRVIRIAPIQVDNGHPAYASQQAVANLRSGAKVNGTLIVVTHSGVKIFKPPVGKGASKSWDNFTCQSAAVSSFEGNGYALITLGDDGYARAFSIPGLREIGAARVTDALDPRRFSEAIITESGDVFGWTGPAETALLNVWGKGFVL